MRRAAYLHLAASVLLLAASTARGQAAGAGGSEVRANTYTAGDQTNGASALDVLARSLVVWQSATQDGGTAGIYGQFFQQGLPVGAEFRVNTYTTGTQAYPSAAAGGGNYIVVWQDGGKDGSGSGIFGQRFSFSGPLGAEFQVAVGTSGSQARPVVSADVAGNFVVAWSGAGDGDPDGIFARGFNSTGSAITAERRANTYTSGVQSNPSVAMPVGNVFAFVVVWQSEGQEGPSSIFGRRMNVITGALGSEFRVNTDTSAAQDQPSISTSPNANGHAVAWRRVNTSTTDTDIVARYYDISLAPVGAEFRVNAYSGRHEQPSVAVDGSNNFLVVWSDYEGRDGDGAGVLVRRYSYGAPLGNELHVNITTLGSQRNARASAYTGGDFRVVWSSLSQDGSGDGVYTLLLCKKLAGDANNDGAVNVSDVLYLINYLFAGGPPPLSSCDVNGDGFVNVSDVLYLINYLFAGGPAPICVVA